MPNEAEDAYAAAHLEALDRLQRITARVEDLPAPGGETEITWAHAGAMRALVDQMDQVLERL